MIFKEYKIPFTHNEYILSIYYIECTNPTKSNFYVPDGNLDLMLASEPLAVFSGTKPILLNEKNMFWGQKRFTGTIESKKPFKVLGIKLQPWLFPYLKEKRNINLIDNLFPLEHVLSNLFIKKLTQFFEIWNFEDPNTKDIDSLSFILENEILTTLIVKQNFKDILLELKNLNGVCSIAHLNKMYGQSPRTMEYDFKKYIGVKPKEYQNIVRFRKSCMNLKQSKNIIHTALDYGFYDQSHYTNYFTKICKKSPSSFLNQGDFLLSSV